MNKKKKNNKYLEFRRSFLPHQKSFRAMIGMKEPEVNSNNSRHVDPKEAEKRLDEAMEWL